MFFCSKGIGEIVSDVGFLVYVGCRFLREFGGGYGFVKVGEGKVFNRIVGCGRRRRYVFGILSGNFVL